MKNYYPRYIEKLIEWKLKTIGCLVVAGPKFCGKSTTSELFAKSTLKLINSQSIQLAKLEPGVALDGDTPRLIDEWQMVPELWNLVRERVDEAQEFGLYIFTGSATPVNKAEILHSGAGRITTIKMRPMSLYESKDSKGVISLGEILNNPELTILDMNENHTLADMAFYLCRGGWPMTLEHPSEIALEILRNYFDGLFNFESSENATFRDKNPEIMRMVLRSYARNVSSEASCQTLIEDVISSNNRTMAPKTFDEYLDALRDLFIVEDMPAWNTNLRSKTVIRSTPTRHLVDPSIGTCALGISPNDLINDLNTFGLFFEDLVVRDLKVYGMVLGGEVFHYRDSRKLEIDAVMHFRDGRFGLIEIKLGGDKLIEEGATNINKLCADLKRQPAFKMIVTATGAAYKRKDDIYVVPLNLLKA